jgi:hypothetical protein
MLTALAALSPQASDASKLPAIQPMQPLGWLFLIVSVGFVVTLTFYCFYRVLTAPSEDHVVKPPDSLGG